MDHEIYTMLCDFIPRFVGQQRDLEMLMKRLGKQGVVHDISANATYNQFVDHVVTASLNEQWCDELVDALIARAPDSPPDVLLKVKSALAALRKSRGKRPRSSKRARPIDARAESSPSPDVNIQTVRKFHAELIGQLKRARNRDTGLFVSAQGDQSPSPTVSAIAALALHEDALAHVEPDLSVPQSVITKLIGRRQEKDEPDKGAWPPQSGNVSHTLATAWPLFAIAKITPGQLGSLNDSISWLASSAREGKQAWGWHRHMQASAFPTAYALNALLEIVRCEQFSTLPEALRQTVTAAIEGGTNYLLHTAQRPAGHLYWPEIEGQRGLCIATTSMCLHVLRKCVSPDLGVLTYDPASEIAETFAAICSAIGDQGVKNHSLRISLSRAEVEATTWPTIHVTNGVNYTYRYFTPVLVTTLVELFDKETESSRASVLKAACVQLIHWILQQSLKLSESGGFLRGGPANSGTVWATAQGAIVLGRVLKMPSILQHGGGDQLASGPPVSTRSVRRKN